jgi:hypothetical protein
MDNEPVRQHRDIWCPKCECCPTIPLASLAAKYSLTLGTTSLCPQKLVYLMRSLSSLAQADSEQMPAKRGHMVRWSLALTCADACKHACLSWWSLALTSTTMCVSLELSHPRPVITRPWLCKHNTQAHGRGILCRWSPRQTCLFACIHACQSWCKKLELKTIDIHQNWLLKALINEWEQDFTNINQTLTSQKP